MKTFNLLLQTHTKLVSALASFGASRLPGWGPGDGDFCWSKMLRDMAQIRISSGSLETLQFPSTT